MSERETLLRAYRALSEQSDTSWDEYQETGSGKAFGAYIAVNRALSALFLALVMVHGMTLEDVREACAQLSCMRVEIHAHFVLTDEQRANATRLMEAFADGGEWIPWEQKLLERSGIGVRLKGVNKEDGTSHIYLCRMPERE
jgi:hypothetical protein